MTEREVGAEYYDRAVALFWETQVDPALRAIIELAFDTRDEAEAMHEALQRLWANPLARIGAPTARTIEVVEAVEYGERSPGLSR